MQQTMLRAHSFPAGSAQRHTAPARLGAPSRSSVQTRASALPSHSGRSATASQLQTRPFCAQPPRAAGRRTTVRVRANWGAPVEFTPASILSNSAAAAGPLHKLVIDMGPLAAGYTIPGQFVQIKVGDSKPGFFAIASPPGAGGQLEFLIKGAPGTTAELLCNAAAGTAVSVSPVMGRGFPLDRLPASTTPTVLLFATGSGISPIRALLDSGALAGRQVTLYYGTRNPDSTAYRELLPAWQAAGVKVVQVFSEDQSGYVHDVFEREGLASLGAAGAEAGSAVGAVLCGHKAMCQAITGLLTAKGVAPEKILLNF